jgi:uncharacterized protein with PIN domain
MHIVPVEKEDVRGRVPDYIWQNHATFRQCAGCHRIYWPGTHTDRANQMISSIFDDAFAVSGKIRDRKPQS